MTSLSAQRFIVAMGYLFSDGATVARQALAAGEDISGFVGCFAAEPRPEPRRPCGLTFVRSDGTIAIYRLGACEVGTASATLAATAAAMDRLSADPAAGGQ
jgi:hypothetical protein